MNEIRQQLEHLRRIMKREGIDAYLIGTADFHQSEYLAEYFKERQFMSGFTGSAGTLIVTGKEACLWVDGRYFIQAEKQLEGSGIQLMKSGKEGVPDIPQYLEKNLPAGGCFGFDGHTESSREGMDLERRLTKRGVRLNTKMDLVDEVWTGRPPLPKEPVWVLEDRYAGKSAAEKIRDLRKNMKDQGASVHVLTSLDDIAWLLNIRGNDVLMKPLVLSFALIWEETFLLFIDEEKLNQERNEHQGQYECQGQYEHQGQYGDLEQNRHWEEKRRSQEKTGTVREYLEQLGIQIRPYEAVYEETEALSGEQVLLEPEKINYMLYSCLSRKNELIEAINPTSLAKAVKNPVEMENMQKAHIKDGVAVTKFIYWLKQNIGKRHIDEMGAADRLEQFRSEQEGYLGKSFRTISAYGPNAAMCHYMATPETNTKLQAKGFYLVDSGGHYYEGTTDITRTVALGPLSREERIHFTIVLISMLRLGAAKFPYGCRGVNLDYAAREPMWRRGLNFEHGTGHGVGYLLTVHERPNNIRTRLEKNAAESAVLEEGMVTSDEPGLYIEGKYGIRTENLLLCKKAKKNEYGQFMEFEYLTYAPIDLEGIETEIMTDWEISLLNEYHQAVYEKLSPYLNVDEERWLYQVTRPV